MMRSSLSLFTLLAATALTVPAFAQSQLPSIEMNQDALRALGGGAPAAAPTLNPNSMQSTVAPAAPMSNADNSPRITTITPGQPRLVWVKGPDGQQVEMKPDPKPRKKRVKKPVEPKPEVKKEEPAKAAPVEPVKVEDKPAMPPVPAEKPAAPPAPPAAAAPVPMAPAPAGATPPAPPAPAGAVPPPPPAPAGATPPPPPAAAAPAPVPPAAPAGTVPPAPPAAAKMPPAPPIAGGATPPAPPAPAGATPPPPPPPAAAVPAPMAAAPVAVAPAALAPAPTAAAPAAPVVAQPPAPPAAAAKPTGTPELTLGFAATETTLPLSMKESMDKLVAKMKADETQRANIIAYASATADQASTARRVSLSRALSVRAYLIDNGINNLRINVQAEGDKIAPGTQPDRVDVFLVK